MTSACTTSKLVFLLLIAGIVLISVGAASATDAIAVYNADSGAGESTPKIRVWDSDDQGSWGPELELTDAGSPIRFTRIDSVLYNQSTKYAIIAQHDDGNIDAYVCKNDCQTASSWIYTSNIGTAAVRNERNVEVIFEEDTADALFIYGVTDADTTHDLGYKVLPSNDTDLSGLTELYIDDTSASTDIEYIWPNADAHPTSQEIALIGYDRTGSDSSTWIWNGSDWGNEQELSANTASSSRRESVQVSYNTNGIAMTVAPSSTIGNVNYSYWNGSEWSAIAAFDVDPSDTRDVRIASLKPHPTDNEFQFMAVDNGADLATAHWNGSEWNVTANIDTAVDSSSRRVGDVAWLSNGSGILVWDTDSDTGRDFQWVSMAAFNETHQAMAGYESTDNDLLVTTTTDGSNWNWQVVDSPDDIGTYTDIAMPDANTLFVAYFNDTGNTLKFANSSNGATSWTTQTLNETNDPGFFLSIAAPDNQTIFIAHHEGINDDLMLTSSTDGGNSWDTQAIDTNVSTGTYPSIYAFNTTLLYISYYDASNNALKFAKSGDAGASWTTSFVHNDSAASGYGNFGSSIAAPTADTVYISYYYASSTDLLFANSSNGGTSWTNGTVIDVDSLNVGRLNTLQAVDENMLYVSYYNVNTLKIKLANSSNGGVSWDNQSIVRSRTQPSTLVALNASVLLLGHELADTLTMSTSTDFGQSFSSTTAIPGGGNISTRDCEPDCSSPDQVHDYYSAPGAWTRLYRNPTESEAVDVLGIRLNTDAYIGSFSYNGSDYTNYGDVALGGAFGAIATEVFDLAFEAEVPDSCGEITNSTTLSNSVSSTGTCFTIVTNNATLDCDGHTITYGTNAQGVGVAIEDRNNVTVQNCIIKDGNVDHPLGIAINVTNSTNSSLLSNTLQTNGTSSNYGIQLVDSVNTNINNNTIMTLGSSSANYGIYLKSGVSQTSIVNNNVSTNGTSSNFGIYLESAGNNTVINNSITTAGSSSDNYGLYVTNGGSSQNTLLGNIITTGGTNSNYAVYLGIATRHTTVENNSLLPGGTQGSNFGVYIKSNGASNPSHDNNITSNSISTSGGGSNMGVQIELYATNNSISNNSITTGGTSSTNYGVYLIDNVHGNNISGNTISTGGTSINYGAYLESFADNTIFEENIVTTSGTVAGSNYGFFSKTASGLIVRGNSISTTGTSGNIGLQVRNTTNSTVAHNDINTTGSAGASYGLMVYLGAANNNITNNTINTNGTSSNHGVYILDRANNNTFDSNTIATAGSNSYGLLIDNSNGSIMNNTLFLQPTEWLNSDETASNSFFVNTTFDDDDGNVNFATFTLEGAHDAVQSNFNITLNNATLNSSALPDMNTSATITFEGITAVNPTPIVDFENDGTFVACTAISDPVCEEVSFVGGVYVFTVTHFTTYSTTELVPEVDISNTGLLFTNSTSYAALSFFMQNLGAALNVFNWTFDTSESVISSNLVTNLTSNETIFVFIENGFSTNGTFMVVANGTTIEDQDSESVEVGIG